MANVFAGIVTYNPSVERLLMVIESIRHQVDKVVVVDNGSESLERLQNEICSTPDVIVISNKQNDGIAKALNQICQYAIEKGAEWVLTLDHDTLCPNNIISSFKEYVCEKKIGIICPCVYYEGLGLRVDTKNKQYQHIEACMTSGSLTRIKAWEAVGGFDESYFIDFVDNDFCKKVKIAGYDIIRVGNVTMNHQLGDFKTKRILFKEIRGTSHSPLRCYYMARNNILFIKHYRDSINVMKEYMKLCKVLQECIWFADEKGKTIKYIIRGVKDARKGLRGKYMERS